LTAFPKQSKYQANEKNVTVHGFTVGSPVVGGDAGSSVDGRGRGVLGGKGFSLLPFPNSIF
jgi:hypothetical protein